MIWVVLIVCLMVVCCRFKVCMWFVSDLWCGVEYVVEVVFDFVLAET